MPLFGAVRLIATRRTFATGQDLRRDQAVLDKLKADQNFAFDTPKVDAQRGAMSFEELDQKIRSVLKR
ncbi:MAG: hypothetical protein ACXWKP_18970 [Bradyrhizobium sp.]